MIPLQPIGKRCPGRLTWACLGLSLVLTGCAAEEPRAAPTTAPGFSPPPLILLVVIDTLRYDYVGPERGLTPRLDALAATGVTFENGTSTSSWTRSSVASLMTARYPSAIGVLGRDDAIASEIVTLAEVLRASGYHTLGVSTNKNAGEPFGFAQGFDRFETPDLYSSYPGDYEIHTAEGVTLKALELLDQIKDAAPVFLFLHYVDPHDPYLPHPGLLDYPEPPGRFDGSRRQLNMLDRADPATITEADRARVEYLYSGEVKYCDLWVGKLFDSLEERQLMDEAMIVVTSDHGEGLWDHGFRAHGRDLYEEMIRVPLILRWPATSPLAPGTRIAEPVSQLDVAPTILEAAGLSIPEEFQGMDLAPLVQGVERPRKARYVFSELALDGRDFASVREADLKLIRDRRRVRSDAALELFDLEQNPAESENLVVSAKPEAERLESLLSDWSVSMLKEAVAGAQVNLSLLDAEAVENLRALGYLGGGALSAPASTEPGRVLSPVLDFTDPDHPEQQLLGGFYGQGDKWRWMAGQATVLLGRTDEHSRWRVDGFLDLSMHDRDHLTISVRIDHGPPQEFLLEESGKVVLKGSLPPGGKDVRLDLTCDHDFIPAARQGSKDERSLCVIVRSIRLN